MAGPSGTQLTLLVVRSTDVLRDEYTAKLGLLGIVQYLSQSDAVSYLLI